MGEVTTRVQVRPEIAEIGQTMERRLRAKVKAVETGEMPHWRQESLESLFARLQVNVEELKTAPDAATALQKAADAANLANLIRLRIQSEAAQDESSVKNEGYAD